MKIMKIMKMKMTLLKMMSQIKIKTKTRIQKLKSKITPTQLWARGATSKSTTTSISSKKLRLPIRIRMKRHPTWRKSQINLAAKLQPKDKRLRKTRKKKISKMRSHSLSRCVKKHSRSLCLNQ
jgi:hypothetical protein